MNIAANKSKIITNTIPKQIFCEFRFFVLRFVDLWKRMSSKYGYHNNSIHLEHSVQLNILKQKNKTEPNDGELCGIKFADMIVQISSTAKWSDLYDLRNSWIVFADKTESISRE